MSVLGACIGDAAGSVLEFIRRMPTEADVDWALTFPGDPARRLISGQLTDDGELTLALYAALSEKPPTEESFDVLAILRRYVAWWNSSPIDCGSACYGAFHVAARYLDGHLKTFDDYLYDVGKLNHGSQANGALMRATGLAAWASHSLDPGLAAEEIALMACADAQLSHPHLVCQDCNAVYVFACVQLLRGTSPQDCWTAVKAYAANHVQSKAVRRWLTESSDITDLDATRAVGHVRWGFTMSMYFLQNPHIGFEEALRIVLRKGGDTDTNAAIVCGLVGCYQEIPARLRDPVLACRPAARPEWLHLAKNAGIQ
jgi:ADP-ribosyl-[dinitrogen reductase] hydrolase